MPANQDVQDFYELRSGFQGMSDFATAALRFLDRFGIAAFKPSSNGHATNGNGRLAKDVDALREKVTRHYKKKRKYTKRTSQPDAPVAAAAPTAAPTAAPATTGAEKRIMARLFSASILNGLDRVEVRHITDPKARVQLGALIRRGYAKKKGDGYLRTGRDFIADDRKRQNRQRPGPAAAPVPVESDMTITQAAQFLRVSETYVRGLIQKNTVSARKELRPRLGGVKPLPITVLDRASVARFAESLTAPA